LRRYRRGRARPNGRPFQAHQFRIPPGNNAGGYRAVRRNPTRNHACTLQQQKDSMTKQDYALTRFNFRSDARQHGDDASPRNSLTTKETNEPLNASKRLRKMTTTA
jgi:hypothetical protein